MYYSTDLYFRCHTLTGTPGSPRKELQQVVKKLSDTTIAITAAGVKVTLRERYSLYASVEMNNCSNPETLKPLMRFECTTATLLLLPSGVT